MIREILALCACGTGHQAMYSRLRQALVAFQAEETETDSWNQLLHEAERQGVAPLLYQHSRQIDVPLPKDFLRLLQSLHLRSRQANNLRNKATAEILSCYHTAHIAVLPVKGIALCNLVYTESGLRPMRDIDLLVSKDDLAPAKGILLDLGYLPEQGHDIPKDYYHLPPMVKKIAGLPITIELHHNLLPFHPRYPLWPLEKSYDNGQDLTINGIQTRTLSLEDTLWHVYLHGFQAPLTYESFRLIHVADMVTLVETYLDQINWQSLQKEQPTLLNVISCFHYLTPLRQRVSNKLQLAVNKQPAGVGLPYRGWPKRLLKDTSAGELPQLVKDTLWPSQWWLQLHHGHLDGYEYWRARLFEHPRTVWRWLKDYLSLYVNTKRNKSSD